MHVRSISIRLLLALCVPVLGVITAAPAFAAGRIDFAPKVDSPSGGNFPSWGPGPAPVGMVGADFTGDGITDLVAADFQGAGPILMAGKGDGTFRTGTRVGSVGNGFGAVSAG